MLWTLGGALTIVLGYEELRKLWVDSKSGPVLGRVAAIRGRIPALHPRRDAVCAGSLADAYAFPGIHAFTLAAGWHYLLAGP